MLHCCSFTLFSAAACNLLQLLFVSCFILLHLYPVPMQLLIVQIGNVAKTFLQSICSFTALQTSAFSLLQLHSLTRLYGAFIELGGGLSGLLHISQISFDRVTNVGGVLAEGDKLKVSAHILPFSYCPYAFA